jgi:hypothetical protein
MAGEEELYYSLLEKKEESCDIARRAYIEHNEAKALMYELDLGSTGNSFLLMYQK